MNDRDYRELQLSSTHLVLIFLSIIALGVIIFLLGISVGKKQVEVSKETLMPTEHITEQSGILLPQAEVQKEEEQKPPPEKPKPSKKPAESKTNTPAVKADKNLYYVQIGAYSKKDGAMKLAEQFKNMGYPTVIIDPLSTDRRAIFRVRIGGYKTREEAIKVKQELLKITGKKDTDYFVRYVK
jgi:cell division septation protein DedD